MSSPAASIAVGAIGAYQRFLSPRKGFRCALHARTGGMTCSNYGLFAIREYGLWAALPRISARLHACSEYATDPMKGKISEDDPGPLEFGACNRKSGDAEIGCLTYFLAELACGSCLVIPF